MYFPSRKDIMPFRRSYGKRKRTFKRKFNPRYKRRKYSRSSAASAIQRLVRMRRARARLGRSKKRYAIRKINRSRQEMVFKNFTIVAPDSFLVNPQTPVGGLGHVCTDGAGNITECIELGMILKDATAPNGTAIFSPELQNYLELYKQCKIVHGSVSLMKYCQGLGDGQASTGTPPTSSIGIAGSKHWVSYLHSAVDTGQFRAVDQLQDLGVPAASNIASIIPNEYLCNSNARFKQLSWDAKKSVKTKVLCARPRDEWSQQYYGVFSAAVPPVAQSQLRCNCPWIDTKEIENVAKNLLPAAHPNYKSLYALTRLPPVSFFGTGFPLRVQTTAGIPANVSVPLFKALISITVAFRVPTLRN